jgi:hypothetical protein
MHKFFEWRVSCATQTVCTGTIELGSNPEYDMAILYKLYLSAAKRADLTILRYC